uniref:Tubulin-specific chaperone A n=1 Tax=Alexandrium andersonii TaxID=327968 RepID=A0A7S2B156_9DINO|mmetsp:Transcript_20905/g.47609  ORF Transcript_20905/g.47609 Transcript_20905/m.47609 type:complete len:100 (+) Transcript_20905:103-402(+)
MGESFSRSCQACWDPEGTAAIVRKKKAQRAAINSYQEVLNRLEDAMNSTGDVQGTMNELRKAERDLQAKNEGKFWDDLQLHNDWGPLAQKAADLKAKMR